MTVTTRRDIWSSSILRFFCNEEKFRRGPSEQEFSPARIAQTDPIKFHQTNSDIFSHLILGDKSKYGEESILRLMSELDRYIDLPQRDTKSPFLVPIDNIISVQGRGTVVIGEINDFSSSLSVNRTDIFLAVLKRFV